MRRRRFLALCGSASVVGLSGCAGDSGSATDAATTTAEPTETTGDRPDGVYVQTFQEGMSMQGQAADGDYRFALMFTVPHSFWTVTGDTLSKTPRESADSLHLMATVWDPETETVVPETGLSVEITRDGDLVSQEVIYPMLSQPMGFHYGGNFGLDGDGTYTATVSAGATNVRRTGAFADRFADPASVDIQFEFTEESRQAVSSEPIDQGGERGALRPMEMMSMPKGTLPAASDLPGTVRGSVLADDANLVVTTLSEPPAGVDGAGPYLAVSARTRYNGYALPGMGLSGTLDRDGETVFEGRLQRTLDPDIGYHYGAVVPSVQTGDELTLSVETPPQVARHEGYETAFLSFGTPTLTL